MKYTLFSFCLFIAFSYSQNTTIIEKKDVGVVDSLSKSTQTNNPKTTQDSLYNWNKEYKSPKYYE